jgi:hypothetical protein
MGVFVSRGFRHRADVSEMKRMTRLPKKEVGRAALAFADTQRAYPKPTSTVSAHGL